jgi:hypothetical protein
LLLQVLKKNRLEENTVSRQMSAGRARTGTHTVCTSSSAVTSLCKATLTCLHPLEEEEEEEEEE